MIQHDTGRWRVRCLVRSVVVCQLETLKMRETENAGQKNTEPYVTKMQGVKNAGLENAGSK